MCAPENFSIENIIGVVGGFFGIIGAALSFFNTVNNFRKDRLDSKVFAGHVINAKTHGVDYWWDPSPLKERSDFESLTRLTLKGLLVYNPTKGFQLKV